MKVSNRLTLIGSVNPFSGYGKMVIRAFEAIESTGTFIEVRPLKPHPEAPAFIKERYVETTNNDWELIIGPPTICPTPGKKSAYFTMNETNKLTPENVSLLNKADLVIVPNEWNMHVFHNSGVRGLVRIVPLGIDEKIFNSKPLPPNDVVIFGTAGSGPRKGIPDVIEAFLKAFPDDNSVRLKVKITTQDEAPDVSDPRIEVLRLDTRDEDMAVWYQSIHCFVSGSRGEGWGLMQQEADCMGRAVICDAVGGWWMDMFPNYKFRLTPAPPPYLGDWSDVQIEDMCDAMRAIAFEVNNDKTFLPVSAGYTWDRYGSELVHVLQEHKVIAEPKIQVIEEITPLTPDYVADHAFAMAQKNLPSYYHSGNLGDIIYGLYAIREHCWDIGDQGAHLMIGPCQHKSGPGALAKPITREQYDMLLPLLLEQSWIKRVTWKEHYPMADPGTDMNAFRKLWAKRHQMGIRTLCEMQFELLGIRDKFAVDEAWLQAPRDPDVHHNRIVIHRSARWRQDEKMWKALVSQFRPHLLFVGLADEYFDFENRFGAVSFWKVRDFAELATLIAQAKGFVGNQSFPCSIALALEQNVFQEQSVATPDCTFPRANFHTQKESIKTVIGGWLEEGW